MADSRAEAVKIQDKLETPCARKGEKKIKWHDERIQASFTGLSLATSVTI